MRPFICMDWISTMRFLAQYFRHVFIKFSIQIHLTQAFSKRFDLTIIYTRTISKFQDDYLNHLFQTGGHRFLEHFLNFSDTHMTVFLYEFKVWLKPKTIHTQIGYLSNFIGDLLFEFTLCQLSKYKLTMSMLLLLG